jgi:arylsulfatase A-like enzyme
LLGLSDLIDSVLDALPSNTIVVFASDNGYLLGEHRWFGKMILHEEAIRVPLYFAGDDVAEQSRNDLVGLVDLAPTLLEIAGADALHADGRSVAALLRKGPTRGWRKKLPLESAGYLTIPTTTGTRWKNRKKIKLPKLQLFNLRRDPFELDPQD